MPTGFTTVSATLLQDVTGAPLSNATISFLPVDNAGIPRSFRAGGGGGQVIKQAVSVDVVGGGFTIQLADSALTNPENMGYRVTVKDAAGHVLLDSGYSCIQPTGPNWSFDSFDPNFGAQLTIQSGPQGLSLFQEAVLNGFSGSFSDFQESQKGDVNSHAVSLGSNAAAAYTHQRAGSILSPQLVDFSKFVVGSPNNAGVIDTGNPNGRTSQLIPIGDMTEFVCSSPLGQSSDNAVAYYYADLTTHSVVNGYQPDHVAINIPPGPSFFCVALDHSYVDANIVVMAGSTIPAFVPPFGVYTPIPNQVQTATLRRNTDYSSRALGALLTNQLVDFTKVVVGTLNGSGTVDSSAANVRTTEIISTKGAAFFTPNQQLGYGATYPYCFYRADGSLELGPVNSRPDANVPIAIPSDATGFAVSADHTYFDGDTPGFTLTFGTVPLAAATPFGPVVPFPAANPWANARMGFWGDSWVTNNYGAGANPAFWQQQVCTLLGATWTFNSGRPGRLVQDFFEDFPGINTGNVNSVVCTYNASTGYPDTGGVNGGPVGGGHAYTLPQMLANVDLLFIVIGQNSVAAGVPLGVVTDTTATVSLYGGYYNILSILFAAKPTLRVMLMTCPYLGRQAVGLTGFQAIQAACINMGARFGVGVCDAFTKFGLNPVNWGSSGWLNTDAGLDGNSGNQYTHLSEAGWVHASAIIARAINSY